MNFLFQLLHKYQDQVCFIDAAAKLFCAWLRTSLSIWYLCFQLIESFGGPWETTKGGKG